MARNQFARTSISGNGRALKLFGIVAVAMLIALVLATGIASFGGRVRDGVGTHETQRVIPKALSSIMLLGPAEPVIAGTSLKDVELKPLSTHRNRVPPGAISDRAELRGKFAKVDLEPDKPIQRDQLTDNYSRSFIPPNPGFRAVSLDIDAATRDEGLISVGRRVNVLLTLGSGSSAETDTIVSRALVLAIDSSAPSTGNFPTNFRRGNGLITLYVPTQVAIDLVTAELAGKLKFTLANNADSVGTAKAPVSADDLLSTAPAKTAAVDDCNEYGRMKYGDGDWQPVPCLRDAKNGKQGGGR